MGIFIISVSEYSNPPPGESPRPNSEILAALFNSSF